MLRKPAEIQEQLVRLGKFHYVGWPKWIDGQWVIRVNQRAPESAALMFFHVDEHGHPLYQEQYLYMGEFEHIMGTWKTWAEDREHRHLYIVLSQKKKKQFRKRN